MWKDLGVLYIIYRLKLGDLNVKKHWFLAAEMQL